MSMVEVHQLEFSMVDGLKVRVPYWSIDSGKPGPRVLVIAAQHGNEVQGSEVIRRFMPLAAEGLVRGSCLLVPFANPYAIRHHQPHIDFELTRSPFRDTANNLNCTWPGDPEGNNAERLSHALFGTLVPEATHLIDLHCWNVFWAGTVLAREGHDEQVALAEATAMRFGRRSPAPPEGRHRLTTPCLLSNYFLATGRVGMCIEFAGQYGLWPKECDRGERALRNCCRQLDMLEGELEGREEGPLWLNDCGEAALVAPCDGLFVRAAYDTSYRVEEGAGLGHIVSDVDLSTTALIAPASGYLYQYGAAHPNTSEHSMMWTHPHVKKDELLIRIVVPG